MFNHQQNFRTAYGASECTVGRAFRSIDVASFDGCVHSRVESQTFVGGEFGTAQTTDEFVATVVFICVSPRVRLQTPSRSECLITSIALVAYTFARVIVMVLQVIEFLQAITALVNIYRDFGGLFSRLKRNLSV